MHFRLFDGALLSISRKRSLVFTLVTTIIFVYGVKLDFVIVYGVNLEFVIVYGACLEFVIVYGVKLEFVIVYGVMELIILQVQFSMAQLGPQA